MNNNEELLARLGSDYDENGVPYWKKIKCTREGCNNLATTYCIIDDTDFACNDHATGDYHRELED